MSISYVAYIYIYITREKSERKEEKAKKLQNYTVYGAKNLLTKIQDLI